MQEHASQGSGSKMVQTDLPPRASLQREMLMACSYVEENYSSKLTLRAVSARVAVSRSYFCTSFKRYTGVSFVHYLQKLRLENAARLLSDTDYSIRRIAHMVGYPKPTYFTRLFYEAYGLLPSKYRNGIE